jgi:hypothetical protein
MNVKRLENPTGYFTNSTRNSMRSVSALNSTLVDDIKTKHLNLMRELTRIPNINFEDVTKMLADFQIKMFASDILGKAPQFDIKNEWDKITQTFQAVSKTPTVNEVLIKDAWQMYSIDVTRLVVKLAHKT